LSQIKRGLIFLAASGYEHPTYIMDPDGNRIAPAPRHGDAAISIVDLNKLWWDPQLGDMRARRAKEDRVDIRLPLVRKADAGNGAAVQTKARGKQLSCRVRITIP
jgi:hypothetical protein